MSAAVAAMPSANAPLGPPPAYVVMMAFVSMRLTRPLSRSLT